MVMYARGDAVPQLAAALTVVHVLGVSITVSQLLAQAADEKNAIFGVVHRVAGASHEQEQLGGGAFSSAFPWYELVNSAVQGGGAPESA